MEQVKWERMTADEAPRMHELIELMHLGTYDQAGATVELFRFAARDELTDRTLFRLTHGRGASYWEVAL